VSQKNVSPLACYNFDTCERILILFGRKVTDKVSTEKTFYCATSNNFFFCNYLVKRRNAKVAFSIKCCTSALPEFNRLLDFFNLFDSRLIHTLLYDCLLGEGMIQKKGS